MGLPLRISVHSVELQLSHLRRRSLSSRLAKGATAAASRPLPLGFERPHAVGTASCREHLALDQQLAFDERRPPMETHAHAHAAQDKELRLAGFQSQARTQGQQLAQRVRAVEHPHACTGHGFQDLAPPLVNQVRRRNDQCAWIALLQALQQHGSADGHHGLARAHFGVQHGRRLALVGQQLDDGLDGLRLRGERLAFEALQDLLAILPDACLAVSLMHVDRRVLGPHLVQQALAKLADEIAQRDGLADHIGQEVLALDLAKFARGIRCCNRCNGSCVLLQDGCGGVETSMICSKIRAHR